MATAVTALRLTTTRSVSDDEATEPSDSELVLRARRGDQAAFRRIVERHQSAVATAVTGMLGKTQVAREVGHEAFVRFYRTLEQYRGDATLRTYLTRIAINLSLNELKRIQRGRNRFEELDASMADRLGGTFDDAAERAERKRLVQAAVAALDAPFRAVVVLRLLQGYSTKETAEILGLPTGTVLSRLSRAQKKLMKRLEPYFKDDQ